MTNAISMNGLTKHYKDVQALTDLTLDVPAGTVFGFLGPNGAGKTTALKVLAGLARATAGSATVNGVAVSAAGEHRRQLGYLAQDPRFYGWMTGRETLRYVAQLPRRRRRPRARIDSLLDRVGIADAADRRTSTYSGGMRQRLGIAQALVGRPAVILLDEPVSALDPIGRKDVLDLMRELKGETTVFYSTHILDDVQRVSDHVAILDHGRLVKAAPTQVAARLVHREHARASSSAARTRPTEIGLRADPRRRLDVTVVSANGATTTYDVTTADGRIGRRPALDHPVRRRRRPDAHQQRGGDARPRDRLPAPHRPEGGGGMTAQSAASRRRPITDPRRGGPFLGFGTVIPQGAHRVAPRAQGPASSLGVSIARRGLHDPDPVHRRGDRRGGVRRPRCRTTRPPTSCSAGPARPSP